MLAIFGGRFKRGAFELPRHPRLLVQGAHHGPPSYAAAAAEDFWHTQLLVGRQGNHGLSSALYSCGAV